MITNTNTWQKNILKALKERASQNIYDTDKTNYQREIATIEFFEETLEKDKYGKRFMELVTLSEDVYYCLNDMKLINTGVCPITGETVGTDYSWGYKYEYLDRFVNLSKKGQEICKRINKNEQNGLNFNISNKMMKRKLAFNILKYSSYIASIVITYMLVRPDNIKTWFLFLILSFIFGFILYALTLYVFMKIKNIPISKKYKYIK